ncbi:MAG: tRNA pseudouridine(55) synthase TruB [Chloroflexota bacterium]|nr:tRNA pseudouridine(55) synthase TruB [Chloroflexota bacterium]
MRDPIGVLNIDKPRGLTSHDVVARIRKIAGLQRVGHAGTLDPLARGVLVVCLGKATRLIEYLVDTRKSYVATVEFGIVTDTWDAEGEIIERRKVEPLSPQRIEEALDRFRGTIEQVPPMYSALKHDGQPLYRLARKGIEVQREARSVEIHRLEVREWSPPNLVIDIECSKGTYIRSLAHDLGETVGVGAYLSDLTRTAVGPFCLERAVSLEQLAADGGAPWQDYMLPIYEAFAHIPSVTVDTETKKRIGYGQQVSLPLAPKAEIIFAYDSDRHIVAVLESDAHGGSLWRPRKVLNTN